MENNILKQKFQKNLRITEKQIPLERHEKINTPTLHKLSSLDKAQHQDPTVKERTFLITTPAHGIHSDRPNRTIPPSIQQRQQIALTAVCMLTGFTFCIPLKSKRREDVIKAYIDHICCLFGPSRKILTDNRTEFKNKLWTEVFEKLKTEQKFTPIYSPQCNGRIEGFHKFLKATIAKQLETHVEWDNLVWKATAAYNFFPTESSGVAPFFLMFGCEAAVKHTLLESESPKYLGTDDGMINIGLMTKLYHVVAHNLNEARKARDKNKKNKTSKEPELLKIGDNVLIRDHTSKAFQPKYKDFCVVGLLGKN